MLEIHFLVLALNDCNNKGVSELGLFEMNPGSEFRTVDGKNHLHVTCNDNGAIITEG